MTERPSDQQPGDKERAQLADEIEAGCPMLFADNVEGIDGYDAHLPRSAWRMIVNALRTPRSAAVACGVTSGSLICELPAGHDGAHNGSGLIFGTPRSASVACIERCEKYLHGTGQGSICGLRKLERENATHSPADSRSHK